MKWHFIKALVFQVVRGVYGINSCGIATDFETHYCGITVTVFLLPQYYCIVLYPCGCHGITTVAVAVSSIIPGRTLNRSL